MAYLLAHPSSVFTFYVLRSAKSTIMSWTEEKDVVFCREILVSKLFETKKSSPERGQVWNDIADTLTKIRQPIFRVNQKSVRDHFNKLVAAHKRKTREEHNASGISPEVREIDRLLDEIVELEAEQEAEKENKENDNNRKMEMERVAADDMRKAMERQAETQRRKAEEGDKAPRKKRRSNGSDTIAYLHEKTEMEMKQRKDEMELKKAEIELEKEKQDKQMKQQAALLEQQNNMMQAMIDQQQQQQQMQAMQTMMMQQQQQQSQVLMALLEKLSK